MSNKAIMLYGHLALTFLHIYAKTQPTALTTSHIIEKHVPETNMYTKLGLCHTCQIFDGINGKCTHIYLPHKEQCTHI